MCKQFDVIESEALDPRGSWALGSVTQGMLWPLILGVQGQHKTACHRHKYANRVMS